jgi:hypothetical protein
MPQKIHTTLMFRPALFALLVALILQTSTVAAQSVAGPIYALRTARAPRARLRAVQEIARTRPVGSREALEAALRDRVAGVRRVAAITLGELGDPAAMPALGRCSTDRDRNVRQAAQASLRALSAMPRSAQFAAAPRTTPTIAPAAATTASPLTAPIDWRQVSVVVSVGNLQGRAGTPADVALLRESLQRAVVATAGFALNPGTLPPVAMARVRSRAMRWYSLEGSLASLQVTRETGSLRVRAEVSMAILAEPGHNIIGTLSTAASASEQVFAAAASDPTPRLTRTAIEVAARGAVQRMQEQFMAPVRRPRR